MKKANIIWIVSKIKVSRLHNTKTYVLYLFLFNLCLRKINNMLVGTYSFLKVNLTYYLCIEKLLVIGIIMKGWINSYLFYPYQYCHHFKGGFMQNWNLSWYLSSENFTLQPFVILYLYKYEIHHLLKKWHVFYHAPVSI